jgi:Ca-activated chloride channel family protein
MKYSIKRLIHSGEVLVTILMAGTLACIFAQNKDESIRVDTNLVLINVLVRDKIGQPIRGLKAEQFEVLDDETKRPIETFSTEEAPISFGIVYDMHPTTDELTKSVIESLRRFKTELGPGDDIFLVAFNMRGEQTFDFVPTLDQLQKHMSAPGKREPYSLYDAVYFASDRIQTSRNQRRVLIIISDSADHHSRHTFSEVREKLSDIRAEVYAVIFDENYGYGYSDITHKTKEQYPFFKDASPLDRAAIMDLTLRSGGSTFVGGFQNALRLSTIYTQIAKDMRSHYTLGFYPEVVDDKQHRIRIRLRGVPGAKDFVLTYRPSYRNPRRSVR